MSIPFAETLKNIVDVFDNIYEIENPTEQWITGVKFAWIVLKDWAIYLMTFQWLNDFVQFPIILPHGSQSIFTDFLSSETNYLNLANISGPPPEIAFLSGFLSCCFFYLPFSSVQFIWLRQVVLDRKSLGIGKAATIGIILGNLSLNGCCLFGFKDIINVWFGLEPLSYFFGVALTFMVIFEMTHSPPLIKTKAERKELWKIGLINFILIWMNPPGVFQFLENLPLHSGTSALDADFVHSPYFYFFGVIIGSLFWTFLIRVSLLGFEEIFTDITKLPSSYWIRGLNYFCLIGAITVTLGSFHYYGIDYLLINPLGFLPEDRVWEAPLMPRINLKTETMDTSKGRLGDKSSFESVDTDLTTFDRTRYKGGPVVESHIESLNYREEYAWRGRIDRASSRRRAVGEVNFETDEFLIGDEAILLRQQERKQKERKKRIQKEKKLKKLQLQLQKKHKKDQQPTRISFYPETDNDVLTEPQLPWSTPELFDVYEEFLERFIEDYAAEANFEDNEVPDLNNEKMIYFSAFSEFDKYGFDLFSIFEPLDIDPLDEELAKEMKEKYSENFINRFLLHLNISNFLKRQPYKLSSQDEISLFDKRLALGEYYDTLLSYSNLPISEAFQSLFCGPKSYVNRIYNQQFQGTFKFVERLFSIHLEDEQNIPPLIIVDNDKETRDGEADIEVIVANSRNSPEENLYLKLKKDPSILKFDQPLYKTNFLQKNPLIHEQYLEDLESSQQNADSNPLISEDIEKPFPFFVGWDRDQRKFLVTNRLLTSRKVFSNTNISVIKDDFRRFSSAQTSMKRNSKSKVLEFTTWPVTKEALQKNPSLTRLYRTLDDEIPSVDDVFKYTEPLMDEPIVIYETLPSLVQRLQLKSPERLSLVSLAPKRGGFIWPAHTPSKYLSQFEIPKNPISDWFSGFGGMNLKPKAKRPPTPPPSL
uniref:Ycf1 n=1 Tax=Rhipiliopsis peltata TaxID=2320810 RepID=A0A386B167_9CHLO|nr:hypothetical protein Ycf1 [Rhipiliopsis peltata]AYC65439.1 hypothetical protein Ycf1 [Rhipiliopsis peltata]